jgi:hypothetical protein
MISFHMSKTSEIASLYSSVLFWDVDISTLEADKNSRLIIERVFSLGTLDEMRTVIKHYGKKRVIDNLARLNYLDEKTLNFVSVVFDKPKTEFRCYLRMQSGPRLWNL